MNPSCPLRPHLNPPGGLFDLTVVANLYPGLSPGARKLLLHRAVRHAEVIRLKPGVFILAPPYRRSHPHPFVLAAVLHSPSHVSLQSALAHHGLIPEAVYQVSSMTVARSRSFAAPLGVFSFQRVPVADLVYLDAAVRWEFDGLAWLTESLHIEPEDLAGLSFARFDEIRDAFRDGRSREYLQGLEEALHADRAGA